MASGNRKKDIKLLVEKFIRLVESLNPGERLTIRKVTSKKRIGVPKPTARNRKVTIPKSRISKTRTAKAKSRP